MRTNPSVISFSIKCVRFINHKMTNPLHPTTIMRCCNTFGFQWKFQGNRADRILIHVLIKYVLLSGIPVISDIIQHLLLHWLPGISDIIKYILLNWFPVISDIIKYVLLNWFPVISDIIKYVLLNWFPVISHIIKCVLLNWLPFISDMSRQYGSSVSIYGWASLHM